MEAITEASIITNVERTSPNSALIEVELDPSIEFATLVFNLYDYTSESSNSDLEVSENRAEHYG